MSDLPLRPNVCILVYDSDGRLILGERYGRPGVWQFPQGGVESDLSEKENVLRELDEELGIKKHHVGMMTKLKAKNEYDYAEIPEYAVGRYRGQSQSFWLAEFLGDDSDIDVHSKHPEFSGWRWATTDQVRQLAEKKRLPGYEDALQEYSKFQKKLHNS